MELEDMGVDWVTIEVQNAPELESTADLLKKGVPLMRAKCAWEFWKTFTASSNRNYRDANNKMQLFGAILSYAREAVDMRNNPEMSEFEGGKLKTLRFSYASFQKFCSTKEALANSNLSHLFLKHCYHDENTKTAFLTIPREGACLISDTYENMTRNCKSAKDMTDRCIQLMAQLLGPLVSTLVPLTVMERVRGEDPDSTFLIPLEPLEWVVGKEIGQGEFGTVFECNGLRGIKAALKIMTLKKLELEEGWDNFYREMMMNLRLPNHPNLMRSVNMDIVPLGDLKAGTLKFIFALETELCKCSLETWFRSLPKIPANFPWDKIALVVEQCMSALHCLHDHGFVHGDLHLGNIMVQREETDSISATIIDYDDMRSAMECRKSRIPHGEEAVSAGSSGYNPTRGSMDALVDRKRKDLHWFFHELNAAISRCHQDSELYKAIETKLHNTEINCTQDLLDHKLLSFDIQRLLKTDRFEKSIVFQKAEEYVNRDDLDRFMPFHFDMERYKTTTNQVLKLARDLYVRFSTTEESFTELYVLLGLTHFHGFAHVVNNIYKPWKAIFDTDASDFDRKIGRSYIMCDADTMLKCQGDS